MDEAYDPPAIGNIDLDAKRRAREVARGPAAPLTFTLGGRTYTLPAEVPADFLDHLTANRLRQAFETLLGDQFATFWADKPSIDDLRALADAMAAAYGLGALGNS